MARVFTAIEEYRAEQKHADRLLLFAWSVAGGCIGTATVLWLVFNAPFSLALRVHF